jgi:hypothetical protein
VGTLPLWTHLTAGVHRYDLVSQGCGMLAHLLMRHQRIWIPLPNLYEARWQWIGSLLGHIAQDLLPAAIPGLIEVALIRTNDGEHI